MFAASDEASEVADITNSVLRLKNELSRHWTARNASEKLTHLSVANLAIAKRAAVKMAPENTVKTMLPNVTFARKFQKGAKKPKTTVITAIKPEQRYRASRDLSPKRIHTSRSVPKSVVPT